MESCKAFGTESECLMLKNDDGEPRCTFEPLGEYEDCETVWPTTTTTTEEVGCCYADSYKANDKCGRATDRARCEDMGCSFLVTDDPSDCEMTTTSTPTTTVTPGCCKGTSRTSNDACNAIEDPDQCDRRSSCVFIAFGILDEDCVFPTDAPPSEPRCYFEPLGEYEDCETVWPTTTTTTEEIGCCYA